jgi:hypothetical protein
VLGSPATDVWAACLPLSGPRAEGAGTGASRTPGTPRPARTHPDSRQAAPAGPPLNKRRKFEHTRCGGFNLYGHLFPDRLDEIADRMDQAVCAPNVPHD